MVQVEIARRPAPGSTTPKAIAMEHEPTRRGRDVLRCSRGRFRVERPDALGITLGELELGDTRELLHGRVVELAACERGLDLRQVPQRPRNAHALLSCLRIVAKHAFDVRAHPGLADPEPDLLTFEIA